MPESPIKDKDKSLHPTVSVGCSYLSLPCLSISSTTVLYSGGTKMSFRWRVPSWSKRININQTHYFIWSPWWYKTFSERDHINSDSDALCKGIYLCRYWLTKLSFKQMHFDLMKMCWNKRSINVAICASYMFLSSISTRMHNVKNKGRHRSFITYIWLSKSLWYCFNSII